MFIRNQWVASVVVLFWVWGSLLESLAFGEASEGGKENPPETLPIMSRPRWSRKRQYSTGVENRDRVYHHASHLEQA